MEIQTEMKIDVVMEIFNFLSSNEFVVEATLIKHIHQKYEMSKYMAREHVKDLFRPWVDGTDAEALIKPMLQKKMMIIRGNPKLLVILHEDWKQMQLSKVRDTWSDRIIPGLWNTS